MTTDEIKPLFDGKRVEVVTDDRDSAYGLRLLLIGPDEVGPLAIEPVALALPDEIALDYSYEQLQSTAPHCPECEYSFQREALSV